MRRLIAVVLAVASLSLGAQTARAETLSVCHGFACHFRTGLAVGQADLGRLAAIMRAGRGSAAAERKAISGAVQYFERRVTAAVSVRDRARSDFGGGRERGQMDCIDESRNTRAFLAYLARRGLLRHHKVRRNASRGFFADGRYPHATAVIEDAGGTRWTVDSWFEAAGGPPDIMPLERWRRRGVMGER